MQADTLQQWHRISPLAVVFFIGSFVRNMLNHGLPALIVIFALFMSADTIVRDWIIRGALVLVIVSMGIALLQYLRFRYCINDGHILVRSGVLHREELDIEFNRVQNVTIKEPFYMRPVGLAVLSIDTAGSKSKEISLAGIERKLALEMRATILDKVEVETTSVDDQEKPQEGLLLALARRDVVIYGLTANFLLWVALAIGAIFGSDDISEKFFGWLATRFEFTELVTTLQNEGGLLLVALVFGLGLFLLFLLLPLFSVIGAIFRYDGYRLTVDGETFRKSAGLLTRHDESLKQHKIQAIVWKQNAVAHFFKRINIQLRQASAGSGLEDGELPGGTKSSFMVPAVIPKQANTLSAEFMPGCDASSTQWSRVDRRRYILIKLILVALPFLPLSLLLAIKINWMFALMLPLALALTWLVSNRCWTKLGYGVNGDYGFIRHGFIGTVTTIFPMFKVQRVDIRQTPIQHRKGLAHMTVHLASHSLSVPYVPMHDASLFRDLALYQAESSTQAWF
jgi:putative membrane protein